MPDALLFAVLGDPISHSRSPQIHQAFAQQWGHPITYEAIRCSAQDLPHQLAQCWSRGHQGLNLTVPLKERALACCDHIDEAAQQAGAVNTLIRQDTEWAGTNTDGAGFLADCETHQISLAGQHVALIGAGGAAKGLCPVLLNQGVSRLTVLNRTEHRAQALVNQLDDSAVQALSLSDAEQPSVDDSTFDLIIQATSAGHEDTSPHLHASWLSADAVAYDLNYGPAHEPFRRWAQAQEICTVDGLGMLVEQARLSFIHWTGWAPESQPVIEQLRAEQVIPSALD